MLADSGVECCMLSVQFDIAFYIRCYCNTMYHICVKNSIIKMKVIKIKMELKLENVCPCLASPFHAQPEDGTDLDTTKSYC